MIDQPTLWTLEEARAWLRDRLDEGARCPCCGQRAQKYLRKIYGKMARGLIQIYLASQTDYVHVPTVTDQRGGDVLKCGLWGLIEEELRVRPDGGRAGYWRLTERGRRYVEGTERVPEVAVVYDGRLQRFDGELRDIRHALGKKFDYNELMTQVQW